MMKIVHLLLLLFLLSCKEEGKQQYFESSPEIDIVKKGNDAFFKKDWEALRSIYADSAKLAENVWEPNQYISASQYIEESQKFTEELQAYSMSDDAIYAMIITSKGEKWVLHWFNFIAKTKDGQEVRMPVNLNARFEDGKIVFQSTMYNQLPLFMAMKPQSDNQ